MADFYEIDFQEVHKSRSGDAITVRYELNGLTWIHVIDAGYTSTGDNLVKYINTHYNKPDLIDYVVVTHPDQDHAEGIPAILNAFTVGRLWVLFPWNYVDEIIDRFERYTNPENLKKKLRQAYPYLAEIERVAAELKIPISEPFQGVTIGAFRVLTPSKARYLDLVVTSAKTPTHVEDNALVQAGRALYEFAKRAAAKIKAAWGVESFPSDGTTNENEMSVVQYGCLCGEKILLTADSGRDGLAEAADYAPLVGLLLPGGFSKVQIPHHGGRHNVSTELLDRWLGAKLAQQPLPGTGSYTAIVSAAREDEDHPRDVVTRAFIHRGANVVSTDDGRGAKSVGYNAPARAGWGPAAPLAYPDSIED